ncbi:hypothetical protein [Pseudomonas sp.]|uniref:hypothetical protein n=1 Tax=Pseudomonas TaxID=286 RepID=UPI002647A83C|nr:hypothetical protein [Pseudomonas sp.]MDN5518941.1 hypothetical protein [Pseudomonas sp.]MDN5530986.1 hypothetical protein [Pseudomonas sp.]
MIEPLESEQQAVPKGTIWTLKNLRDASVGLLMIVVSVRLAFAQTTIDLSGFNFTDLLSLILAIAAVALSAAFYFKADESARSFYNNTYHFTKEVSEILGRIEAGFGQQLAHINEGYAGLNEKIDRMPYDPAFIREQEAAKRAEIQEQEAERDDIIEDLMRRAQLDNAEKSSLQSKLEQVMKELESSKAQLSNLEYKDLGSATVDKYGFTSAGLKWVYDNIHKEFPKAAFIPSASIPTRFNKLVSRGDLPDQIIKHFSQVGLMENGRLTDEGVTFIRSVLERHR